MKISELIEKLQELQNVHGDIDVAYCDNQSELFEPKLRYSKLFEVVEICEED